MTNSRSELPLYEELMSQVSEAVGRDRAWCPLVVEYVYFYSTALFVEDKATYCIRMQVRGRSSRQKGCVAICLFILFMTTDVSILTIKYRLLNCPHDQPSSRFSIFNYLLTASSLVLKSCYLFRITAVMLFTNITIYSRGLVGSKFSMKRAYQ